MKVCENCGEEINIRDIVVGENLCDGCELAESSKRLRARRSRQAREEALRSCGLVKVRGALGGTYWE